MDVKEFNEIFEGIFRAADDTLMNKRKEYVPTSGEVDVLHNFRQAANLQQTNMRKAVGGFLIKHIVSIFDMIGEDELRSMDIWDEKIGDAINYLVLLKAIVVEESESMLSTTIEMPSKVLTMDEVTQKPILTNKVKDI